jgi:SAM-dependent methyltransferase
LSEGIRDRVLCARCKGNLDPRAEAIRCARCGQEYPRVGRTPVLLPRPVDHIDMWRQQLGLLIRQGRETAQVIDGEARAHEAMPAVFARLRALALAARDQLEDLVACVGPALGGPLAPGDRAGLPRGFVEYSHLVYRDWGWEEAGNRENARSLAAVVGRLSRRALGHTLVIGAGACRLAYDLHRFGARETAVLDIDPFLLVIAEAVVRGHAVRLSEATATVQEAAQFARVWNLSAPAGPLGDDVFHFFFANGLDPPFAEASFDTVVTPWFIDQVPTDLPAFFSTVARLLRPEGRWINHGPLIYPADAPLSRRYSREELFELAAAAGLRVKNWSSESCEHLVSPLNGRGKVEWVLTFEAVRDG